MKDIDWRNLDQVIALAKSFGKGQTVKHQEGRDNYNICHTSRRDLWDKAGVTVFYQS